MPCGISQTPVLTPAVLLRSYVVGISVCGMCADPVSDALVVCGTGESGKGVARVLPWPLPPSSLD